MATQEQVDKYGYMFGLAKDGRYPISFGWECCEGWNPLIWELIEKVAELDTEKLLKILQIKEKFGGLRFYILQGTDEIYELIDEYEKKSYKVCEVCGEEGKIRNDLGWIKTLCDKHHQEILDERLEHTSRRKVEPVQESKSVTINAPVFKMNMKG